MKKYLLQLSIICFITISAFGQIEMPRPSPITTINQKIGLTDVTVEYSRPGKKDREIFGKLVPFGEMWRTGANASTKVTFAGPVNIDGKEVPAGTYALYSIPNADEWTIILHKNTSYNGTGGDNYKASEDQMRFMVKPTKTNDNIETFTIDFDKNIQNSSHMVLSWDNTRVAFEVSAPVEKQMMASIENTLNPGAYPYYQAATFYHESGKDLNKALEYINTAIEKYQASNTKAYWVARRKAMIQADLKDYKGAIKTAEMSSEWAAAEKAQNYVDMNNESIAEWKKMK